MRIPTLFLTGLLLAAEGRADGRLIPTDVLFDEPLTYSYELSPDSRFLAGYMNFAGNKKLILVDNSDSRRYVLIDFKYLPRIHVQHHQWIDDDTLFLRFGEAGDAAEDIAFVDFAFVDGVPEPTIRRTRARGALVDPLPSVEDTVLFAWEAAPGRSGYRLYTITVEQLQESDFSAAREFRNSLSDAIMYRMDEGSGSLLAATARGERVQHWYLDEFRKRWIRYFEHDPRDYQFFPAGQLADDRFAVLTNKDTDRISLVEFDLANKAIGNILYQHPNYDLTGAEVVEDGSFVRSVSYVDHGRTVTEYFAQADSHIAQLLQKAFPQKHAQLMSGAGNGTRKILYVSASDDPGTYYLLDTRTGEAEILSSLYQSAETYELSSSNVFNVPTADGEHVEAILTRPEASNGVLLVNPHGGPIGVRDYASYNPATQFFASRGYSVLNVNFRGSSGFGRKFLDTGRGQFGKRIEEDISTVVAHVTAEYEFTNLCAIGASYGGYSALMLAIRHPELYRCVIGIFGIYDLPFLFNTSNYTLLEEEQKALEAVIGEYSDALREVSPFYLAEGIDAPVLLIAGTEDTIADYEQTNRMKYRLQQLAKPVEYFYYADTGHGHDTWRGDRHQFALADDFIRRKLELELPAATNTAEVIGAEYSLIAEYYENTSFIDDNMDLALRYYGKAAELGDARALYRLASFHEEGTHAVRDPDLAYGYLLRSSDAGYAEASNRLARLHRDGEDGELSRDIDARRSFELFRKAREQGHVLARFDVAQALCNGAGVEPDIAECLSLLTFDRDDEDGVDAKAKRRRRSSVFGKLAWSVPPGSEAATKITEFIGSSLDARHSDIHLEIRESGLVRDNGRIRGDEIPAKKGVSFGLAFRVDDSPGGSFVVKGRLTGPATTDGQDRVVEEFIRVGDSDEETRLTYELMDGGAPVEGDWTLEIRSLDHELLAEVTFRVGGQ